MPVSGSSPSVKSIRRGMVNATEEGVLLKVGKFDIEKAVFSSPAGVLSVESDEEIMIRGAGWISWNMTEYF